MPTKKKAEKVTPEPAEGPTPVSRSGYRRPPRYTWREYSPSDLPEGCDPLRVKVQTNLTFAQLDDIQIGSETTFEEAFKKIAPFVIEWNNVAENEETGEMVSVPSPAEAGWEVLQTLDYSEGFWLVYTVRNAHLGDESRKKGSTPSAPMPKPPDNNGTDAKT